MMQITILIVVLLAGLAAGVAVRLREGRIRTSSVDAMTGDDTRIEMLAAVGVQGEVPAVVHFSADWCGPCAAVRRVVAGVVADLAETPQPPLDIEVDIDAEPALAKELNVLSLPTTFVFDARGRERFRISGVPKPGDLRSALSPLTVPEAA